MRDLIACAVVVLYFAASSAAQPTARPVIAADGLVYVSGMTGAGADVTSQATAAIEEISTLLTSAGSSLPNVANVTVMLRSAADFTALNAVFAASWPSAPPARTTVVVGGSLSRAGALVELSVVAVPEGGERVVMHPAGWLKPPSPYSYGIKTGNTLFLAGLVSRNAADNTPVAGDITVQTKTIMNAASAILQSAGMTVADVVSSKIFLADMAVFQTMNAEYRTHFPASPPARATVKATPPSAGSVIEIAMIAVKDPSRRTILPPNADGTPGTPSPILSPAIHVGRRLYLAGMLGNTPATKGNVQAQTAETLVRLGRALEAAGYDWSHVVESTVFLPDMVKAAEMEVAYRGVFAKDPPIRTIMPTPLVGADALVEIMLTAVK